MWCMFCKLSSVHPSYCSVRMRYVVYVLWTILSTPVVLLWIVYRTYTTYLTRTEQYDGCTEDSLQNTHHISHPYRAIRRVEICGVCSVNYPQYTCRIALYGWDMWCVFCELSSVHPSYCSVRVRYVVYVLWTINTTGVLRIVHRTYTTYLIRTEQYDGCTEDSSQNIHHISHPYRAIRRVYWG
jgi:beta-lactamase regulating signal transducer with metallopeptidase domain